MGTLIEGKWEDTPMVSSDKEEHFQRLDSTFRDWITQDGSSGYQAEPNRYHLYISYACPWACRTLILRSLKGLEDVISASVVEPIVVNRGWEFGSKENKTVDPVNHTSYLYEIYLKANSTYTGKVTVPVLWDKKKKTIVNNESAEIIRMLNSAFNAYAKNSYDFYPNALRKEIDDINEFVYDNINNGYIVTLW